MRAAATAVDSDAADPPHCWCCGATVPKTGLVRLGSHPEVTCAFAARTICISKHVAAKTPERPLRARCTTWSARHDPASCGGDGIG